MKYFNIAGPCSKEEHYMIDAATRLEGVEDLIEEELYFIIHAARQSGKTTYLADLTNRLNAGGKYYTVYCSLETLQGIDNANCSSVFFYKLLNLSNGQPGTPPCI
jgi:AAA+ ATPase superfamily predicted ATPase